MKSHETWNSQTADPGLLYRCKAAIRGIIPDADVILYGSRARGDAISDSDYDILVLSDERVNIKMKEDLVSCIYPIELETGEVLTLIAYSRNDWNSPLYRVMPFRVNVEQEGVLL